MPKPALAIWTNGKSVGTWYQERGKHVLQYDPSWARSSEGRALSLALPFTPGNTPHRGNIVENYFDNLLPDSDRIRARIRSKFSTSSTEAFELLTAIGRDCVGAVQLLPEGDAPTGYNRIEAEPLQDRQIESAIAGSLSGEPIFGQRDADEFRISIAGAQEKTAFLYHKGRWCRPLNATPTTHIFKLPLGLVGHLQVDMKGSVENEWLCSRLMAAFSLPVAACEILEFGQRKVLSVERFDRTYIPDGWIARVPQEDFCQALGLPSSKKYESEGGPGIRDIVRILDTSSNAIADKRAFIKTQILFWLLSATDGHAKNFSIFLDRGGQYRLTPLYDVLSAWPIIGRGPNLIHYRSLKLAMAVRSKNVHLKLWEIKARHWMAVAKASGLGENTDIVQEIAAEIPKAIQIVNAQIPSTFPSELSDKILGELQRQAPLLGDLG
jgi:serine/threonine-protein kinase HipA